MNDKFSSHRFLSSINFRISLISVFAFAILALGVALIVFSSARNEALRDAEEKAMIILNRNLATHQYINSEMKPRLFSLTKSFISSDYFDPFWMSSTFAIRRINSINDELPGNEGYYYKECAINARSPLNEADNFEKQFLLELEKDQQFKVKSGVRHIAGKHYFYLLRRGESMEEGCLRCHSTSDKAPLGLVAQYGPERSFHRKAGDLVSALSIRIPLEKAYFETNKLALHLSLVVAISFAGMFLMLYLLMQKYIFIPLSLIRRKTDDICEKEQNLGIDIQGHYGTEINDLVATFNTMSHKLKDHMDNLECRVTERTAELEKALENVRVLKGMLPICASCKKIRDDNGYWSQVESYISQHTEAVFTSGICPECEKKMYAELERLKNQNN